MPDKAVYSNTLYVRVTPRMYNEIKAYARRKEQTISTIVRCFVADSFHQMDEQARRWAEDEQVHHR